MFCSYFLNSSMSSTFLLPLNIFFLSKHKLCTLSELVPQNQELFVFRSSIFSQRCKLSPLQICNLFSPFFASFQSSSTDDVHHYICFLFFCMKNKFVLLV